MGGAIERQGLWCPNSQLAEHVRNRMDENECAWARSFLFMDMVTLKQEEVESRGDRSSEEW